MIIAQSFPKFVFNISIFFRTNIKKLVYHLAVYFLDDTHLLVIPEALFLLNENEDGDIIIPCRPTSPDVNVTLFKNDEEVNYDIDYQIYSLSTLVNVY